MTRILMTVCLVVLVILGFNSISSADNYYPFNENLTKMLAEAGEEDFLPIVIIMKDRPDLDGLRFETRGMLRSERKKYVAEELKSFSGFSQADLIYWLENKELSGDVREIRPLWICNAIGLEARPELVYDLAQWPDILRINGDPYRQLYPEDIQFNPLNELDEVVWSVDLINAPDVWDQGYTGQGIIVGIIDSGVDYNHTDLNDHLNQNLGEDFDGDGAVLEYDDEAGIWVFDPDDENGVDDDNNGYVDDFIGWNFEGDNNSPMDGDGHGTHVAGSICGDGTGGTETGVAPDASLVSCRVGTLADPTNEQRIWDGLQYLLDLGVDVTNLSMGWWHAWGPDRQVWRETYDAMEIGGVVNCVASGNEGPGQGSCRTPGDVPSPWRHPDQITDGTQSGVITVGATDDADNVAGFSSRGPMDWEGITGFDDYWNDGVDNFGLVLPDVVAPGQGVNSLQNGGGYANGWDGTSMASPHAAGTACLMLSKSPELSTVQIDSILQVTAVDMNAEGKDNTSGSGRVDALAAVDAAIAVTGFIEGTVTDLNTDEPLEGVEVLLNDGRFWSDTTNAEGFYSMEVVRGTHLVYVDHEPYAYFEQADVQVDSAETTFVDIGLGIGLFLVEPETLDVLLTDDLPQDHILTMSNAGTAPIEVFLEMVPAFELDDSMDIVQTFNPTELTGDTWISGMCYADGIFYLSGANGLNNPNYIYKIDFDGNLFGAFEQPGSNHPGANPQGMRDLAFDGTYLYGGINAGIYVMNPKTGYLVNQFAGPYSPNQAMAYDPDNDLLWVARNTQDIVGVDKETGEELDRITSELYVDAITHWPGEPDGFTLYMSARELNDSRRNVYRASPELDSIEFVMELPDFEEAGTRLKGLALVEQFNTYFNAIACLMSTDDWSVIVVRELNMEIPYASYSPDHFYLVSGQDREVTVSITSAGLPDGDYRSDIIATYTLPDSPTMIPILLTLDLVAVADNRNGAMPSKYALHKPYPNPFNNSTVIRFDLPQKSNVSLNVFDILGRNVAQLSTGSYNAGSYNVVFDGSGLASGIYFVRMNAGDGFNSTTKMVLLK